MRKIHGYMTVEASFIVPMVICVFALLIYLANFMYGRCLLTQDCYILAFRASMEDSPKEYVVQKSGLFGRKYFGNKEPVFEAEADKKAVTVRAATQTKHRAMGNYFLKPGGVWEISAKQSVKVRNYPGHLRRVKRIMDLANNLKEK